MKARAGFTTLTADQAHSVLRPIALAGGDAADADADAVAPTLVDLQDPFLARLARAEEAANERLDESLSEGQRPLVVRLDLGLRGRELASAADLDALLEELRRRLSEPLQGGVRVRLA